MRSQPDVFSGRNRRIWQCQHPCTSVTQVFAHCCLGRIWIAAEHCAQDLDVLVLRAFDLFALHRLTDSPHYERHVELRHQLLELRVASKFKQCSVDQKILRVELGRRTDVQFDLAQHRVQRLLALPTGNCCRGEPRREAFKQFADLEELAISRRDRRRTVAPRLGISSTSPSDARCPKASRSVPRLKPKCSIRSRAISRWP